jgi:hypothetical protein
VNSTRAIAGDKFDPEAVAGDVMTGFIGGVAGALIGKALKGLGYIFCFTAGTQVVVGTNDDGTWKTVSIEDLHEGDFVLARDQGNAEDDVEAQQVVRVFKNTAYNLQRVLISDDLGNTEELVSTEDHPFWVADVQQWIKASELESGMMLQQPDGSEAVVVSNSPESRPDGVSVFNIEVQNDHTYFVAGSDSSADVAVLVHNTCSPLESLRLTITNGRDAGSKMLRAAMVNAYGLKAAAGKAAHHVVPLELATDPVTSKIIERAAKGGFDINGLGNGKFWDDVFVHDGSHPGYTAQVKDFLAANYDSAMTDADVAGFVQQAADLFRGVKPNY